jgi:hypothetical protein
MDPEEANKILEFILQICERTNKIENDGTYHHHWCGAGGV